MQQSRTFKAAGGIALALAVAGCGNGTGIGNSIFSGGNRVGPPSDRVLEQRQNTPVERLKRERRESGTLFDLFQANDDPNVTVEVNKYLWNAALDVLSFLPIEAADPFSGVIVTGYGVPPGGGQAYRATIYVQDPALEARSLTVALNTQRGPASQATVRAVEDAILTRARQLRVRDSRL